MRTIFIIVDTGAAIRNVLRTAIFDTLRQQPELRLVIFTPIEEADFTRELAAHNVLFERVPKWKANPLVKMMRSFRRDLWAETTALFSYRHRREKRRNRALRTFLLPRITKWFFNGDPQRFLAFLHRWEMRFTPVLEKKYFDLYQPDLLFFTSLYSMDPCLELSAWKQGIKTICLLHSWDNPTTKGPFPFEPDRLIVWNEILRQEVRAYHGYPPERVQLSGVPQFDLYFERESFLSREAFFAKHGLDPARKLVTYTTGSSGMVPFEPELVERLHRDLMDPDFPFEVQLLVRMHPKDDLGLYQHLQGRPHLILTRPGTHARIIDQWNPTREEMFGLAELMLYSDVVINVASTITLDAAMFDTPVINVAFDADRQEAFYNSCKRYYQYEHYRNIVATGGVPVVESWEALRQSVGDLLRDPTLFAEGRRRIREEQALFVDGGSSERVARFILDYLNE
ncbi:MAG: CDP-glycerol glycerophosphotransferase family protein [Magnetococcales bacterium]|nr:CDP-glycerol glycerophosphotransferase family protein [Magnetococcales bacterium]